MGDKNSKCNRSAEKKERGGSYAAKAPENKGREHVGRRSTLRSVTSQKVLYLAQFIGPDYINAFFLGIVLCCRTCGICDHDREDMVSNYLGRPQTI